MLSFTMCDIHMVTVMPVHEESIKYFACGFVNERERERKLVTANRGERNKLEEKKCKTEDRGCGEQNKRFLSVKYFILCYEY